MKENIQAFFGVWLMLIILNQIFIYHGCFAPYCLLAALPHTGVLAFLWVKFLIAPKTPDKKVDASFEQIKRDNERNKLKQDAIKAAIKKATEKANQKAKESNQPATKNNQPNSPKNPKPSKKPKNRDPLKEKGDRYERFIGSEFEKKGELVIYNGFIKGYEDQGVDLISIASDVKSINLIQCKNWTKMRMTLAHMEAVYEKLNQYDFDCLSLPSYQVDEYRTSTLKKGNTYSILSKAKNELPTLTIRKTLFIASEKVVDLEVGPYLTMMTPTIFKYKDMKIVMKGIG